MDSTREWLRQVLQRYQNADRTYTDAEAVLMAYNSIIPKMDTFSKQLFEAHDNGTSAVLLCLHGTIPITFRGVTYNIPIAVWVPFTYPLHPPMCYVTPTATMLVRMSKHVDLAGKIYHPTLAVWHSRPDEQSLLKLLGILQEVFSLEPPVYSKPASQPGATNTSATTTATATTRSNPINIGNGSPLTSANYPLHPQQQQQQQQQQQFSQPFSSPSTPPPVPPNPYSQSSRSSSPAQPQTMLNHPQFAGNRPLSPPAPGTASSNSPPHHQTGSNNIMYPVAQPFGRIAPQQPSPSSSPHLMNSGLSPMVSGSMPVAANPQEAKAMSLRMALRERILATESSRRARNAMNQERLIGINRRLHEGEARIRDILRRLEDEKAKVRHSREILVAKNHEIKGMVERLSSEPEVPVDELLDGGSVVYNQLYEAVADEHALDDTIYSLGQALNSEKIPLPPFLKHGRTLARELFYKRALIKKIRDHLQLR
ncbi:hypothetical protein HDU97_000278 [Phlyctochytrium planicorne]|nr:hypothetical protein HDU97_000278 [Phlyctochytrium planicorne]